MVMSTASIKVRFFGEQAVKDIEKLKQTTQNATSSIRKGFMGAFGGIASMYLGVKAIKSVYDNSLKLVDLSDKWGRPTSEISKFSNALALLGGSSDDALRAIDTLEQSLVDLRTTGSGPLKTVANQLGITAQKQNGEWKNSLEILNDIRKSFKNIKDEATRSKVAEELGLNSPAMLRLLKLSDVEYAKLNKEAGKFGVIEKKNADQLKKVRESITELKMSFSSLAGSILNDIRPAIDFLSKAFKSLAESPEWVRKLTVGLGALLSLKGFSAIATGIKGITTALTFLAGHPVVATIMALVGGITAIVKGIDYFTKKEGDKRAEEWLANGGNTEDLKEKMDALQHTGSTVLMSRPEDYSRYTTNNNSTRTVNVGGITVISPNPSQAGQDVYNTLNRQLSGGVI